MSTILFLNEKCGYFGGVEQNIADTVDGLSKRGHKCYLGYSVKTEKDAENYADLFEGVSPCLELQNDSDSEPDGLSFEEIFSDINPDVLYLHKVPQIEFCEPYINRCHTVRMIHDHDLCCPRKHKYFIHNGRVCRHKADWRCYLDLAFLERDRTTKSGMKWADIQPKFREIRRNLIIETMLVGSRFMQEELLQNGFRQDQVHIMPPVVQFEQPVLTPVPSDPHILYVGQLIRGKGVDLLLQALSQLQIDYHCTIVGTGNGEEQLKGLSESLGLSDRVHFTGWVPHDGLNTYYKEAKVIVVPSRWPEPFGMIGLEAMRHGRPLVGFDVGGISDWLIDNFNGFLVPEQNVDHMAARIKTILTDHDIAEIFGKNGYKHVNEAFSFEDYLDNMEKHLTG